MEDDAIVKLATSKIRANLQRIEEINKELAEIEKRANDSKNKKFYAGDVKLLKI